MSFYSARVSSNILLCAVLCAIGATGCFNVQPSGNTVAPDDRFALPVRAEGNSDQAAGATQAETAQWSGWRGATLHAVSADKDLPVRWDSSLGVRWSTPVPGRGNSSPVVWDDQIFFTSMVSTAAGDALALLCFDRRDGQLHWQTQLGMPSGNTHAKNGYASSTVATDGQHVVAFFGSCGLFCCQVDGQQLWHVAAAAVDQRWGAASSPVLFGDLVIQVCDGERQSFVAAYNKSTGDEVWRAQRDSVGSWSTPALVVAKHGDLARSELIVSGTGTADGSPGDMIAYDPSTGNEFWRANGTSDIACPTAIVGDDLVVSSSGGNGPIFAIRPGGNGNVTESRLAWKQRRGGPYVPTGLIYDQRLFVISDGGVLTCFESSNGEQVWRTRLPGEFSASLVAGDGKIYATSEAGDVYVFAAADEFELLATNRMKESCLATPAIAHGEILLRTRHRLFCIVKTPADEITRRNEGVRHGGDDAIASPSDVVPIESGPIDGVSEAVPVVVPADIQPARGDVE